jgi:hypothetical protein
MQASRASSHLIMLDNRTFFFRQGEIDTIKRYCNALPNATIIVRLFHDEQGDWKSYPNAAEYQANWAWVKQQLGSLATRVVFDDPCNEPNLAPASHPDTALYVDRCVKLIEAAGNAGIKLAIGAFSVGSLQESVLSSTYKPLWQALKIHRQAISWHLYGAIPFEAGEIAPLDIVLDASKARAYMKDERWPMSHQGWLIAESFRVIQICESMGFVPDIYITECIVDNVLGQNPVVKEAWRAKYGLDMFMRDPRGIRCWSRYLTEFFAQEGLSFEHSIMTLLTHARKNILYHPAFKGACLFALNAQWDYGYDGRADGTNKHAGSNFDRPEYTLLRSTLLGIVNTQVFPTPMPEPAPETLVLKRIRSTDAKTNWRQSPGTSAAILGTIGSEWTEANVSSAYTTLQWVTVAMNGKTGYCAREYLVIEDIPTVPSEPVYEVQVAQLSVRGNAAMMNVYADVFTTLADVFNNPTRVE